MTNELNLESNLEGRAIDHANGSLLHSNSKKFHEQNTNPSATEKIILRNAVAYYSELRFMPSGSVKDLWHIREYEFVHNTVRIKFDREYSSALRNSPSHVVPTTMSIIAQHMSAAFFSRRFGFDFETEERVKIWPTYFAHEIRTLIVSEKDLIMEQVHNKIRKLGTEKNKDSIYYDKEKYYFESLATINGDMPMTAKSILYVI